MEVVKRDDQARCVEVPVYYAPPLDRAKFVKTKDERLALFYNPDVLLFFLRLQIEQYLR